MDYPDINKFSKKNEYLICIDSDGTAIDAMNVKHNRCHGPCFISEWGLEENREEIQKLWNQINLFDSTRGINRYLALVKMLERLDENYLRGEGLSELKEWVLGTKDLSNKGIKEEIRKNDSAVLKKALKWSLAINAEIAKLTAEDKKAFEGVKECLEYAKGKVDIAVISSSNMEAIYEEWGHYDLIKYVDVMTSQEIGTKGECIARMMDKGYDKTHVLMMGDAYPDVDAAKENGVYFYPVLTGYEKESWEDLRSKYLDEFVSGRYEKHQKLLENKFINNFGK